MRESETAHFIGIWDGSEISPHKRKKKREAQLYLPLIYCPKPAKQTAFTPLKVPFIIPKIRNLAVHHFLCKTPLNQGFRIQQLKPKHQADKGQAEGILALLKVELPAGQGLVGYST